MQTLLLNPLIGNLGLATLMFGENYLLSELPETVGAVVTIPLEAIVLDVIIAPDILSSAPRLSVFRGSDMVMNEMPPEPSPILGDYKVQFLGTGTSDIATADVPRYPELIRSAARDLSRDIETFDVWRVRLEFPVYHSTCRLELPVEKGNRI